MIPVKFWRSILPDTCIANAAAEPSDDQMGLQVNLEQWNQFLEAAHYSAN
jgi:hypothetical protein